MDRIPSISEAEWQVMEQLWLRSPATANEVVESLAERVDWHPRTVKTLLNRLVKKGALGFEKDGRRYLYRPIVSRRQCVQRDSQTFLNRVFRGAPMSLLTYFVENESLTDEEVEKLRRLVEKRRA